MKQKKEKKLRLGKETIQNFGYVLDRDEQKRIKGGTANNPGYATIVPVYC